MTTATCWILGLILGHPWAGLSIGAVFGAYVLAYILEGSEHRWWTLLWFVFWIVGVFVNHPWFGFLIGLGAATLVDVAIRKQVRENMDELPRSPKQLPRVALIEHVHEWAPHAVFFNHQYCTFHGCYVNRAVHDDADDALIDATASREQKRPNAKARQAALWAGGPTVIVVFIFVALSSGAHPSRRVSTAPSQQVRHYNTAHYRTHTSPRQTLSVDRQARGRRSRQQLLKHKHQ